MVVGIDAHKRTDTAAAVVEHGKRLTSKTVSATSAGKLELVRWAGQFGEHTFAVEDCWHLSRVWSGTCWPKYFSPLTPCLKSIRYNLERLTLRETDDRVGPARASRG